MTNENWKKDREIAAQEQVTLRIEAIKESLESINVQLGKYDSLIAPDFGHAGDLAHIESLLFEVLEFIVDSK